VVAVGVQAGHEEARQSQLARPARASPPGRYRSVPAGHSPAEHRGLRRLPANYGQKLEVTGSLTDTATNSPIGGGTVLIYTTNLATGAVHLADIARTGPRGRFAYRLRQALAGVSISCISGPTTPKALTRRWNTTTAGRLRVRAARTVRVGQHMRITGRILGGSIAGKGALVQMWYRIEGHKGSWEPFQGRPVKRARRVRDPLSDHGR